MIPASFDYVRPQSLEDALAQLGEHGDDARVLAGGHSLLPVMKARLADPGVLVDIAGIEGLSGISESEDGIRIGAMTTHAEIEASELVQGKCRALAEAAGAIGDLQVRNRGTLGGSLAHADPGADYPAVVLAAGAEITVAGAGGERVVGADDFFTGTYETALGAGEILTSVQIRDSAARGASAYLKAAQQASGFRGLRRGGPTRAGRKRRCRVHPRGSDGRGRNSVSRYERRGRACGQRAECGIDPQGGCGGRRRRRCAR